MTSGPDPIQLAHENGNIAVYLVETSDGIALIDCGPTTTIPALREGLAVRGFALSDLHHLLLTHVHLDHAGAAGVLTREHPALQVHLSELGARHIIDPSRLEASARQTFGETFDANWGELAPVPEENVRIVGERVLGLECLPTPGHVWHHVSYLDSDGTLFAGDAAGMRFPGCGYTLPLTPPPQIDLEAWYETLTVIGRRAPDRLALAHFGVVEDPSEHLPLYRRELALWAERVRVGMTEDEFVSVGGRDLEERGGAATEYGVPLSFQAAYKGLTLYWGKRRDGAGVSAPVAGATGDALRSHPESLGGNDRTAAC